MLRGISDQSYQTLTGFFAETMFPMFGHGQVGLACPWDAETKTSNIWGTSHTALFWPTAIGTAEFTAEFIQRDDAAKGGP